MRPTRRLHHRPQGALAALLLAALGSGCTPSPAPLPSGHEHHVNGAAGTVAPTTVPAASTLHSFCEVQAPPPGQDQLRSVELGVAEDQLVLAFDLTHAVADELTVKVVAASDAAGAGAGAGFSVTAAVRGAVPVAVTLQTPTSTSSAARPEDFVHVEGHQIHIGVPSSLVVQLGRRWHWSASTASATTHASCPAARSGPATIAVS